jgi:hypothetical protein
MQTQATQSITSPRDEIINALHTWINQRPGMDPRNYISSWDDHTGRTAYRAEVRHIGQQLQDARTLLRAVELRQSITAADLVAGMTAYSGRLQWINGKLEYCTGQYWPTEYRAAVCAALSQVLWAYWRTAGDTPATGDSIRKTARQELGRGVAHRWFR